MQNEYDDVVTEKEKKLVFRNRHFYDHMQADENGILNLDRMLRGLPPISIDGKEVIIIYNFTDSDDGAWVVLDPSFHRKNFDKLHARNKILGKSLDIKRFDRENRLFWNREAKSIIDEWYSHSYQ